MIGLVSNISPQGRLVETLLYFFKQFRCDTTRVVPIEKEHHVKQLAL